MKVMNILPKSFSRKSLYPKGRNSYSVLFLLFLLMIASFTAAILFGSTPLDLSQWNAPTSATFRILYYLRLPRALGATLAGSALAVAGVLIQAVLQNPMAAPNIIGINSGAGLAVVILLALAPGALAYLPLAAFGGALLACLCIYFIAARTQLSKLGITLVGIAVSSILTAGISTVKSLFPDSIYDANAFSVGGLGGVSYSRLNPAWWMILLGLLAAFWMARQADVLSLGEDTAKSLGMNLGRTRFAMLFTAAVLAGSAVSFGGLLGFVGLLVPHIARRWVGTEHRFLIPASAMGGACLILLSDLLGRCLFAPYELPVGILLSFLGGPFFIGLILTRKGRAFYD